MSSISSREKEAFEGTGSNLKNIYEMWIIDLENCKNLTNMLFKEKLIQNFKNLTNMLFRVKLIQNQIIWLSLVNVIKIY